MSDIDFDYKLDPMAVVFDVGGFEGDFTELIRKRYLCGVHVFEPTKQYFAHILKRFIKDPLVWPYPVALEDEDCEKEIYFCNNGSSLHFARGDVKELINVRDIFKFIGSFKLPRIHLLKMNCEGSEFKILNRLIETDYIPFVDQIVVQFHAFPDDRQDEVESKLRLTHVPAFQDAHWQWWKRHPIEWKHFPDNPTPKLP